MIAHVYDPTKQHADITRLTGLNLDTDEGLESYITECLFSDARAQDSDGIEDGADKRGWWGEAFLDRTGGYGSRLWLLKRSKLTAANMLLAAEYAKEALAHLIDLGVASDVTATCARMANRVDTAVITIGIQRPRETAPRFESLWEVQFGV